MNENIYTDRSVTEKLRIQGTAHVATSLNLSSQQESCQFPLCKRDSSPHQPWRIGTGKPRISNISNIDFRSLLPSLELFWQAMFNHFASRQGYLSSNKLQDREKIVITRGTAPYSSLSSNLYGLKEISRVDLLHNSQYASIDE